MKILLIFGQFAGLGGFCRLIFLGPAHFLGGWLWSWHGKPQCFKFCEDAVQGVDPKKLAAGPSWGQKDQAAEASPGPGRPREAKGMAPLPAQNGGGMRPAWGCRPPSSCPPAAAFDLHGAVGRLRHLAPAKRSPGERPSLQKFPPSGAWLGPAGGVALRSGKAEGRAPLAESRPRPALAAPMIRW